MQLGRGNRRKYQRWVEVYTPGCVSHTAAAYGGRSQRHQLAIRSIVHSLVSCGLADLAVVKFSMPLTLGVWSCGLLRGTARVGKKEKEDLQASLNAPAQTRPGMGEVRTWDPGPCPPPPRSRISWSVRRIFLQDMALQVNRASCDVNMRWSSVYGMSLRCGELRWRFLHDSYVQIIICKTGHVIISRIVSVQEILCGSHD